MTPSNSTIVGLKEHSPYSLWTIQAKEEQLLATIMSRAETIFS